MEHTEKLLISSSETFCCDHQLVSTSSKFLFARFGLSCDKLGVELSKRTCTLKDNMKLINFNFH